MPARPPRLKQRRDFKAIAAKGTRAARPGVVVQALPAPDTILRVGFTATKKLGNAVVRNRTKRRLREAARSLLGAGQAQGFDIVLIGREATKDRPWPTLLGDLRGALKQAGVLRPAQPDEAANAARAQTDRDAQCDSGLREAVTPTACLRHDAADAAARRLRAQQ